MAKKKAKCDYCVLIELAASAAKQGRFLRIESIPTSTTVYYVGKHTHDTYKLAHCMDRTPSRCTCPAKQEAWSERKFQGLFKVSI